VGVEKEELFSRWREELQQRAAGDDAWISAGSEVEEERGGYH
jgi:hypothetical protein